MDAMNSGPPPQMFNGPPPQVFFDRQERGAVEATTGGTGSSAMPPPHPDANPDSHPDPDPDPDPRSDPHPEIGEPSPRDLQLVQYSLELLKPRADRATAEFYALLFLYSPQLRELFPAAMDLQRDRLFRALLHSTRALAEHPDGQDEALRALGRGHRKYGTRPAHYAPVGAALIEAVRRHTSLTWDDSLDGAWRRVYHRLARTMIEAAEEDARTAPACWLAEITEVEPRTRDIAVLTVRPDQPYPFRAGQYTTLETPWWPRIWRHYSFASAPRPDGLLTFHVKAVPAGWVSNALVHRARPGNVLRLGPPLGGMTVDHSAGRGLLCLGGGTGIAPIQAIVEEAAERYDGGRSQDGGDRRIEVFYGARRADELYGLDALLNLASRHPWLGVRPVVSDAAPDRLSGRLPDVVRRFGPWDAYDAYLSGPPAMVRDAVSALLVGGMPAERIRHDLEAVRE